MALSNTRKKQNNADVDDAGDERGEGLGQRMAKLDQKWTCNKNRDKLVLMDLLKV